MNYFFLIFYILSISSFQFLKYNDLFLISILYSYLLKVSNKGDRVTRKSSYRSIISLHTLNSSFPEKVWIEVTKKH